MCVLLQRRKQRPREVGMRQGAQLEKAEAASLSPQYSSGAGCYQRGRGVVFIWKGECACKEVQGDVTGEI